MGSHISKDVFDHLLDHMLDIHHQKIRIVSAYKLDYDLYTANIEFLNSYIRKIEAFLETAVTNGADHRLPFVILGSVVRIRNIRKRGTMRVKIVLPNDRSGIEEEGIEIHNCFSDWGKALLLGKTGDHIRVGDACEEYVIDRIEGYIRPVGPPNENI